MKRAVVFAVLLSMLAVPGIRAFGQEGAQAAMKADKTGTNPINFQNELRVYNEFSWLNTAGDGEQNVTTLEGRTPLLDGKLQFRARARYSWIKADLDDDGSDDIDESGFGDVDFRLLSVPVLDVANKRALAVGLEVFLDTAEEDVLGSGTTSLGPQVFFVKFLPRGFFAPALQYKFSVNEASGRSQVDQFLIDLLLFAMAKDKQSWFFMDPQIVIDNESDAEFGIVDVEFGAMMTKWGMDLPGHSAYIRPSVGVGNDRPTDGSVEVGYKIVF